MRKLLRVDLLIIDDFALQALDALDTSDTYELVVERHRAAATVVTSNREPVEWLGLMADPLLGQSAIDRLQSAAHELVLDDHGKALGAYPSAYLELTYPN
jgi:DNA replication protein DnaC